VSKKTTTAALRNTTSAFTPPKSYQPDLAADLLRGCAAIAAFIGDDERQTFYGLQTGAIPAIKQGRLWISTKSRLIKHYNEARYEPPPKPEPAPVTARPRLRGNRRANTRSVRDRSRTTQSGL